MDILGKGPHKQQPWGLPAHKWVLVLPWWGCDFNCKHDRSCKVLQGPLKYRHNTASDPAAPVDAMPGYEQIMPLRALSKSQGNFPGEGQQPSINSTSQSVWFPYLNTSTGETHQVWYDDARTLKIKYEWAVKQVRDRVHVRDRDRDRNRNRD